MAIALLEEAVILVCKDRNESVVGMNDYEEGVQDNNAVNGGEIADAEVAKTNSHSVRRRKAVRRRSLEAEGATEDAFLSSSSATTFI